MKVGEAVFLAMRLRFTVKNVGRVAAYKWQLVLTEIGHPEGRSRDYRFHTRDYPEGCVSALSGIRLDDTILPGCAIEDDKDFGLFLRPARFSAEAINDEMVSLIRPLVLMFRVATEVSPGILESISAREVTSAHALAGFIVSAVSPPRTA